MLSDASLERMTLMSIEEERIKTFKHWPFKGNYKCTPAKMAEAGFYSTGKKSEPDLARCYVCYKELDGWEEDDDPWSEHQKHASYCPFIKLGKKPSMLTVNDIVLMQKEGLIYMVNTAFKEKSDKLNTHLAAVTDELERVGLKENEKPKATGRKRSSRK